MTLEILRFEDENDYQYGIWFRVFLPTFFFSRKLNLALLSLLEEVKPSPERKMIRFLTFDNLFPPVRHSRKNS